jgi:cation:H+ antiporter
MPSWVEAVLFVVALAVCLRASHLLATAVDRVGQRLALTDALIGIFTALAADSPEISAAVAALVRHRHEVGVGVVLGSNLFNLAAMLGLPALLVGRIRVGRHGLGLTGGTAIATTALASAMVLRAIPVSAATALVLAVLGGYTLLSSRLPSQIDRWPLGPARGWLRAALTEEENEARPPRRPPVASRVDMALVGPLLAVVVAASSLLVATASTLGRRWGLSQLLVGTVVLAVLTSLPNLLAAVRLARLDRPVAVVSVAMNSNTLNLVGGLCLPALAVGVAPAQPADLAVTVGLLVLTVAAVALAAVDGLRRLEAVVLIVGYVTVVTVVAVL